MKIQTTFVKMKFVEIGLNPLIPGLTLKLSVLNVLSVLKVPSTKFGINIDHKNTNNFC